MNDETNKGEWIELSDEEFRNQLTGLLDYIYDEDICDIDWNSLNFKVYDSDYYRDAFPGFDETVYEILANSTLEENKVLDERQPPLKITHKQTKMCFN